MRRGVGLVLVFGLAGMAGCSGSGSKDATPMPTITSRISVPAGSATATPAGASSTPSASVSPAVSGASSPTSADPSTQPLYLEAVEVYKKIQAETWKIDVAGGAKKLPPVFDSLMAQPYLGLLESLYSDAAKSGTKFLATPVPTSVYAPNSDRQVPSAAVSIQICEDSRKSVVVNAAGKPVDHGVLTYTKVYFTRVGGKLKAFQVDGQEAKACPIGK